MTSRRSSSRLPASSLAWIDGPVTLPGFARSQQDRFRRGLFLREAIGIVDVACSAIGTALPTVTYHIDITADELGR